MTSNRFYRALAASFLYLSMIGAAPSCFHLPQFGQWDEYAGEEYPIYNGVSFYLDPEFSYQTANSCSFSYDIFTIRDLSSFFLDWVEKDYAVGSPLSADMSRYTYSWFVQYKKAAAAYLYPILLSIDRLNREVWGFAWDTAFYYPENVCPAGAPFCAPIYTDLFKDPNSPSTIFYLRMLYSNGYTCSMQWSGILIPQYDPCRRSTTSRFCKTPLTAVLRPHI